MIGVNQWCTTYGPRAKSGPLRLSIWPAKPAKPKMSCIHLITPFECVKTYKFWPLHKAKKIFWPAMRYELCTPGVNFINMLTRSFYVCTVKKKLTDLFFTYDLTVFLRFWDLLTQKLRVSMLMKLTPGVNTSKFRLAYSIKHLT